MSKASRQGKIRELLEAEAVASQAQLADLLADHDITATQATVSRDLEELGAIKVRVAGGTTVYAVPEQPSEQVAPPDHLRRVLGDWLVDAIPSANLVILRTPPGSAHVVASALDRSGLPNIVGTVAGDDTILIVAEEAVGGAAVAAQLRELAGL